MMVKGLVKALSHALGRILILACMCASLCSCTPDPQEYIGSWVGVDELPREKVIVAATITSIGDNQYSVKLEYHYINRNDKSRIMTWDSDAPRYLPGTYISHDGSILTSAGKISLETGSNEIIYRNITMIRRSNVTMNRMRQVVSNFMIRNYRDFDLVERH